VPEPLRTIYESNYRSAMAHGQPPPQYGNLQQFPSDNGSWWDAILQALPHSAGVQVGVSGESGMGTGLAGSSAVGGGIFVDPKKGVTTGDYVSAGGAATNVAGSSVGGGASAWISNVTSSSGLQNMGDTYSCNAGLGPIQGSISVATGPDGTWVIGGAPPVAGYTFGASCSRLQTTTVVQK
jgi:hypothetical protein